MLNLRVFISSPGDVATERAAAQQVISRLNEEFAGRVVLEAILWEHEPLLASGSFQEQISRPSDADVAVFILWARIGTRLPKDVSRPDGSRYASGTEFEFEDARQSFADSQRPLILTYRKVAEVGVSLSDPEAVLEKLAQKAALDDFERKWFHSVEQTSLTGAFHPFEAVEEFESLLELHLRKLVGRMRSEAEGRAAPSTGEDPRSRLVPAAAERRIRSLAILPFGDLSREGDLEYFCDGIAEELRGVLGAIESLLMATTVSRRKFDQLARDPQATGTDLGADAVIEGSVRRAGERLRVAVTVSDIRQGHQVWNKSFDGEEGHILAMQEDIARSVAETFSDDAGGAVVEPPRQGTGDAEAYRFYLKGRHRAGKRTERGLEQSVDFYRQAIDRDPSYAEAFAGLADSYALLGIYGVRPPGEVLARAEKSARRAIALDPDLGHAYASRGCIESIFRWSWDEGEASFLRALEIEPDDPTAHQWYAMNNLAPRRRFDEAVEHLGRAFSLDSESPAIATSIGALRLLNHDFAAAEKELLQALELYPDFGVAHYFLGRARIHQSRFDEAIVALRRAIELTPDRPESMSALGYALGAAGREDAARQQLRELEERAQRVYVSPVHLALAHLGLGHRDESLMLLEQALALRAVELTWLGVNPFFASLASEPRVTALMSRLGLPS